MGHSHPLSTFVLVAAFTVGSTSAQGKRGLNYNNATWANYFQGYPQITWGYNWGWPSNGLSSSFEFVPMLWGLPSGADPDWTTAASAAQHVLGYNEPDLTSQANIIPSDGANGWKTYFDPLPANLQLGAPAVTNSGYGVLPYQGLGWLDSFLGDCNGCKIDFVPVHWYDNATAEVFQNYLIECHTRAQNRPIWITEFMLQDSEASQIAWLKEVMPWMDAQPWIQRYSYFGVFEDFLINGAGNGLSNIGQVYASYTGSGSSTPTTMQTVTTSTTSAPSTGPTGSSGWKSLGCYTDNVSGRALPVSEPVTGGATAMTNEACQTACAGAGYSIAGTEYSQECCKYLCKSENWLVPNFYRVRQQYWKWRRTCF
jgi:hypothetical protein